MTGADREVEEAALAFSDPPARAEHLLLRSGDGQRLPISGEVIRSVGLLLGREHSEPPADEKC